jgi:hypothetical protein
MIPPVCNATLLPIMLEANEVMLAARCVEQIQRSKVRPQLEMQIERVRLALVTSAQAAAALEGFD